MSHCLYCNETVTDIVTVSGRSCFETAVVCIPGQINQYTNDAITLGSRLKGFHEMWADPGF